MSFYGQAQLSFGSIVRDERRRHNTRLLFSIKIISAIRGVILDFKTHFLYFYIGQFR